MTLLPHPRGGFYDPDDPGELQHAGKPPRISVTTEEAALLRDAAAGKRVLEIGTGVGVSTRAMAETAVSVVTLDAEAWVEFHVWPTLPANVQPTLDRAVAFAQGPFDLIFIDGHHGKADIDLHDTRPLLAEGGVIYVHDAEAAAVPDGIRAAGAIVEPLHTHFGLAKVIGWRG